MSRTLRIAHYWVRTAALEDRIPLLMKKYPGVDESVIRDLAFIDPTGQKASYLEWLVRRVKDGNIRWPEDKSRTQQALATYQSLKRSPRLLQQHGVNPDINKYTLHDLEDIADRVQGQDTRSQRQTQVEVRQKGAKLIYDRGGYQVIQVGGEGVPIEDAKQAACLYAKGTKWCTSDPDIAGRYLRDPDNASSTPLYVVFKDGEKIAQTDGDQVMDVRDREIEPGSNPGLFGLLIRLGIYSEALYYLQLAIDQKKPIPEGEDAIAQDASYSITYATGVLHGRFPKGEKAILGDPDSAYRYALKVIRGRWPEGEPVIASDPNASYNYAVAVLKGRFPLGEDTNATNSPVCHHYAQKVIGGRWPQGEDAIIHGYGIHHATKQKIAWNCLDYVIYCVNARWPEGEEAMAQDPDVWYKYKIFYLDRS